MSTSSPTIPPDVAAHVLCHYGRGGYPAGDWAEDLISLISRADDSNRDRFAAGFPDYVAAITAIKYDPNGVAHLLDLAAGRCTRCKTTDGPNTAAGLCEACDQPMPLDGVA
ncbi:hypothetical protein [Streptomyces sp. NPDC020747]|uniref:hypothetical protein n=1 Tax=Streptomyces sp. NPDC020747 TaxID=3365086 RepID=UPI003798294F